MLTADPFNAKVEAFLNRIEDRPAKFPSLNETDLKRFLEIVDLMAGFDIDFKNNTVFKLKPVLDFQGDLFLWAEHNTGHYVLKQQRGCNELWRCDVCVAIKTI